MLIIQTPPSAEAEWAEQGWPATAPAGADGPELLGWAMRTITPAVRAGDWAVVDDLVDEGNVWLAQIRAVHYRHPDPLMHPFLAVTDTLWPEVQRAVGARDADRLTYAARLLAKLCGVADLAGRRPAAAVPAYVAPADRPFLTAAGPNRPGPAGQFLTDLAAVLSNHLGHLVDFADASRPPAGTSLPALGWRSPIEPQGPTLGSLDPSESTLRLRVASLAQLLDLGPEDGSDAVGQSEIGEALAAAWLIDTTLVVDGSGHRRLAGVVDDWWEEGDQELIWRLPDVIAPGPRWRGPTRRR